MDMTLAPTPARDVLRRVFGHGDFRGQQAAIIDHVLGGGDALVLMPTGGGKSMCYQVPALCAEGLTIVVSPLIALMRDQVAALRQAGVAAAALNSSLSAAEASSVKAELRAGRLKLLYVAPERLLMPGFLDSLDPRRISLIAIDEAHCVSQWGHDFRPEYLQLAMLAERFPGVPRLALTATADPQTRVDIQRRLRLDEAAVFLSSFDRPNIRYTIVVKDEPRQQLLSFLKARPGQSGIVYCLSRAKVEETSDWLVSKGIESRPYHAGMAAAIRDANQDAFLKAEGLVLVATTAFGMGIDKPDVRFVAHLDLPGSVEAYYQETGRAGRDGLHADAWMAYGMADVVQRRRMIDEGNAPDEVKRVERAKLDALLGICETAQCRRRALLAYFGEPGSEPCGNCDTCLFPPEIWDGVVAAQKAISTIYRTDQKFGVAHLIDVLRGADTDKIRRFRHNTVSTFGIGKDMTAKEWQSVFRQLVAFGAVEVDHDSYGAMRLTENARAILRGERSIIMRREKRDAVKAALRQSSGKARGNPGAEDLDSASAALFQALRGERLRLAKEQGVPPYVVFHDSTLIALARAKPTHPDDLTDIPGLGARKRETYGAALLAVISGFAAHPS